LPGRAAGWPGIAVGVRPRGRRPGLPPGQDAPGEGQHPAGHRAARQHHTGHDGRVRGQLPEAPRRVQRQPPGQVQVKGAEGRDADHQRELVDRHDDAGRVGRAGHRDPHQHGGHQRAERGGHAGPGHRRRQVEPGAAVPAAAQQEREREQPGRVGGEATDDQRLLAAAADPLPVQADQREREPSGSKGEPGPQRRLTQPALQVQGEHEEEAAEHGQDREQRGHADGHPGQPQHPAGDQGRAARRRHPPLHHGEGGEAGHAGGQARPAPGRPVLGLPEHQREHQGQHGRGQDGESGRVQATARLAPPPRQEPAARDQQRRSDRDVQQEHRPPGAAPQIRADQQPADHLAGHRAARQHGGVQAHRPGPGRAGEGALDEAEHLGDHGRRAGSLHEPKRHQHAGRAGQPAAQRGEGEQGHAEQEHGAVTEDVAEPGAGHQQHRVGDHVAGDDELQATPGRVQAGMDGGGGDVHY
jgi:hypothetical protein